MSDESKTDTFGTILHDVLRYINAKNPDEVTLATEYEVEGTLDDVTVEVTSQIEIAGVSEYNSWETTLYDVEYEDHIEVSLPLDQVIQTCADECSTELVLANLLHIDRETVMAFCHFVAEQAQVQAALDSEVETEADIAPDTAPDTPDGSSVKETVKSILAVEDDRLLLIGLLVESGYIVGTKVV